MPVNIINIFLPFQSFDHIPWVLENCSNGFLHRSFLANRTLISLSSIRLFVIFPVLKEVLLYSLFIHYLVAYFVCATRDFCWPYFHSSGKNGKNQRVSRQCIQHLHILSHLMLTKTLKEGIIVPILKLRTLRSWEVKMYSRFYDTNTMCQTLCCMFSITYYRIWL